MHVKLTLADPLPGITCCIPASAKVGKDVESRSARAVMEENFRKQSKYPEEEATRGQSGHQAPFLMLLVRTENIVLSRGVLGKTSRTSDTETREKRR